MRTTITISRKLGCGGSYVGQLIAGRLGIKYVDREVLHLLAAKEFGCDEETIAARAERVSSFWERVLGGLTLGAADAPYSPPPLRNFSDKQLFDTQTRILRKVATETDCVVIGWAGVHVLRRHPGTFSAFFHAPLDFRIDRVMRLYHAPTKEAARDMIHESDRSRKKYFESMTGHYWACAEDFQLVIDTSLLPLEEIADKIIELAGKKRARHG